MFIIGIAGLRIRIINTYDYVAKMCKKYIVENTEFDFSVKVSEHEILFRMEASTILEADKGYFEGLILYEKIAQKMLEYNGFMLHAAIVEVDGVSYAFSAPSGTGKSTHAMLWLNHFGEKAKIINGDKPIIRIFDDKVFACGTPWCGKESFNYNKISPLRSLCFLSRSKTNSIRSVDDSELSELIFNQIIRPDNNHDYDKIFSMLNLLINKIKIYSLSCNISDEAVEVSYNAMK